MAYQPYIKKSDTEIVELPLNASLLDSKESSYYLDYNNLTNTPVIPTKISQLTNDSGFTKITGYSGSGDIKVYKRYSQKGYTGGTSTYWFYKIATLPIYRSSDNYASLIIRGRIGGLETTYMTSVNALIFNKGGEGIVAINLSQVWTAHTYGKCDIVCYRESDNTTSVYLKCKDYFAFDITVESYQEDVILPTSISYTTSVTGFEQVRLSNAPTRLEIYNGNAYVGGTRLVKSNESLKNPKSLTFGSKSYDGSSDITLTADDLGAITSHQDISGKLDKVTTKETYQLYGKNANGEQQMLDYSLGTVGWSIVQRDANGCINTATPTDTYHATTKQYVDERSGVTGVKGDSETSYRTGNVNITKSNIGLSKVRNVSAYSKTETDNLLAKKIDKSNFNTPVIVSNGTTSIQLPSKGIYMVLYYSFKTGKTHVVLITYNGIVDNSQYVSSGYSLNCSTSGLITDSASAQMHARIFKISDYGWGD